MSTGRRASRTWGRGAAVLFAFALAALLVWLFTRDRGARGALQPAAQPEPQALAFATRAVSPAAESARAPTTHEAPTAVPADPYQGMYAGPGPDDPAGPGMLPHPITPEHIRIYRDVELLDGAWQALKRKDFAQARVLLRQHASEYGSRGYDDLNDGLSLLAACMERPSSETRQAAQRFYDEQTASTARKRIRRHCLEQL